MKKIFTCLIALTMLASLTACGSSGSGSSSSSSSGSSQSGSSDEPIVLVVAHTNTEENEAHKALLKFEEYVEANTDGRVDVQIYPNGQLGGERESIEAVELGSVQMTIATASVMSAYDQKFNLMELPFLFSDYDSAYAAYDGELGDIYNGWMEEHNLLNMGFFCGGFRGISNTKNPVYTPDDLKGMKLRCIESDMFVKMFQLLGVNPTPMNYNEIYTGLEQGTIDGQDNPAALTYTSKFYEVLKYYTATNHVALCVPVIMSKSFHDNLDDDIRTVIDEGCAEMLTELREAKKTEEQNAIKAMQEAGLEYTTLTDEQMQLFKDRVTPIYDDYRAIVGDDVMDLALSY